MLSKPIELALIDDHAIFRQTLKNYLSGQENIQVAFQATDIFDMFNQLKATSVDIILMDIFMPQLNGNDAVEMIRKQYPSMKILVLSMSMDLELISQLLDAGIHAYISKGDDPDELLQAIQALSEDRIYRNRLFTEALYWSKLNTAKAPDAAARVVLTDREKKILQLIWEEKSNKEMADELLLGVRSIEKIRQDIKEKIGVKSTVGLLKYALSKKIISNPPVNLPTI